MIRGGVRERREQPRFQVAWRLEGKELKLAGLAREGKEDIILGRIQDISSAGLCLVTHRSLRKLEMLRCEIFPSETEVAIPTLAQVRWTLENRGEQVWRIGLQFLL